MDGMWADDFHHIIKMAVKPEPIAHFKSYDGTPAEIAEALEHGWLFRGREFAYWKKPRGTECRDLPPAQFVHCISNHDQAGNRPCGERLNQMISPAAYRATSMLLLLSPYTPMLFMGQEWAASTPFVFFSNHSGEFGRGVSEGRCREFKQFGAEWPEEALRNMPDPELEESFAVSKLRWEERPEPAHAGVLSLYRECLSLRRNDPVLKHRERDHWQAWTENGVVFLRYAVSGGEERLLAVHLGPQAHEVPWPVAMDSQESWSVLLSSDDPRFQGKNACGMDPETRRFLFNGPAALLVRSGPLA